MTEEDPEEAEEVEESEDENDQPEIDEDEFAELGDLADDVEEQAGADADDSDEDSEDDDDDDELPAPDDEAPTGETWGDLYVGTLTTVSNAVIEEFGDEAETIDEDLARQQHLDEYFNDWMESRGKREDMPPEQALILSTAMFMVTVLGTKTDLVGQLLSEADFDL